MRLYSALLLGLTAVCAQAQDIGPWKFGMSADEIRCFAEFAPYEAFSNGDLETYEGVFAGAKRNVQFYLKDGKLRRLAIRMYEGYDIEQATTAWQGTYAAISAQFGTIDTPKLTDGPIEILAQQARALVEAGSEVHMMPRTQRADEFVSSKFKSLNVPTGRTLYVVTINFDRPPDS